MKHTQSTKTVKPADAGIKWHLIDADGLVLGRLASQIATLIRGKHKPCYSPTQDCGDYVVVINAAGLQLTGKKLEKKTYYRHTGYVGGIKTVTAGKLMEAKPEEVLYKAVQRMVSRGKLGRAQMTKLRIFAGAEHDHAAQLPVVLDIGAKNPKNKRGS